MAMMNLQPPGPLCFNKTEDWPKWLRRFQQYRLASGLSEKGEEYQVSTFLYCLGEKAEEILDTTRISVEKKKKYSKVVEEFDNYFKVHKNVIYGRAWFNKKTSCLMSPWNSSLQKYTGQGIVASLARGRTD